MEEPTIKDLFATKEQKAEAVLYFRGLQNDPGWKILVMMFQQTISILRSQLEDGSEPSKIDESHPEETIEEINMRRTLLRAYKRFINTPQKIIDDFSGPSQEVTTASDLDPFERLPDRERP